MNVLLIAASLGVIALWKQAEAASCCVACQDRYVKTDADWEIDGDHWVKHQVVTSADCDQIRDDGMIDTYECAAAVCKNERYYELSDALYAKDIAQCPDQKFGAGSTQGHVSNVQNYYGKQFINASCTFDNEDGTTTEHDWTVKIHQPATESCCVSCQDRYNKTEADWEMDGEHWVLKYATKTVACKAGEDVYACAEAACKRDYEPNGVLTKDIALCPRHKAGATAGKMNGDVCEWDNGEKDDLSVEIHQV